MKRQTRRNKAIRWTAVAAAALVLLAGCGSSKGKHAAGKKLDIGASTTTTAVLSDQGPSTPHVTVLSPTSGRAGAEVAIEGTGLSNVTGIHLGTLSVFFVIRAGGDLINAYVPVSSPAGAKPFELAYKAGTVGSPPFTVVVPPHKSTTTTSSTTVPKHKSTTTTSTTVPKHKSTTTTSTTVPKHKSTTTTTSTTVPKTTTTTKA